MNENSYQERRSQIETYFDRTAVSAWEKLTSDAPLGRVRTTVRAGRDNMRNTLLSWLPHDMNGMRLLDAGCGTGALSVEAAQRGAEVVAIDLSPTLVDLARSRLAPEVASKIDFRSGDMLDPSLGHFDHVVAMDSIIHYQTEDAVIALSKLAERTSASILFTFAPRTPLLSFMISIGRIFPRRDRAPWLQPMAEEKIFALMKTHATLTPWSSARTQRISSGFYQSQAMEWVKS